MCSQWWDFTKLVRYRDDWCPRTELHIIHLPHSRLVDAGSGRLGEAVCAPRITGSLRVTAWTVRVADSRCTVCPMRDHDVRTALRALLLEEHADQMDRTLFVDELSLCGEARVDVAVVNGALTGYELKSSRDRLDRLPNQVEIYGRILDYAYLVVADVHLARARAMLPSWWGLMVAKEVAGSVVLLHRRKARKNPRIQATALVQLLWRDEALAILAHHGCDYGVRTKPRDIIWDRLSTILELDQLRHEVRAKLRERREWRETPARRGSAGTLLPSSTTPRFLVRRLR